MKFNISYQKLSNICGFKNIYKLFHKSIFFIFLLHNLKLRLWKIVSIFIEKINIFVAFYYFHLDISLIHWLKFRCQFYLKNFFSQFNFIYGNYFLTKFESLYVLYRKKNNLTGFIVSEKYICLVNLFYYIFRAQKMVQTTFVTFKLNEFNVFFFIFDTMDDYSFFDFHPLMLNNRCQKKHIL